MKGYSLLEGKYVKRLISEDELWNTINWLFSTRSKSDSSYKFIFFKAILDNLDELGDTYVLKFDRLFERFTEIGWNLVLKYGIRQKAEAKGKSETYLEQILHASCELDSFAAFKNLGEHERKRICKMVKSKCKTYVVGALYGDTNQLMYSFSKKEEWIESKNEHKHPINTTQLLFFAEEHALYSSENINANISNVDVETELYEDFDTMRAYLAEPLQLISKLKRERGIV